MIIASSIVLQAWLQFSRPWLPSGIGSLGGGGGSVILMSDVATVVSYIKKQGGTVSCVMCDLAHEILTWAEQFGPFHCTVYFGEEQYSHWPSQASWPGSSDQVILSSSGVKLHNRKFEILLVCLSGSSSHGVEGSHFLSQLCDLSVWAFHPFSPQRQVLSRMLISRNLSVILVAPLWLQKEWFADLFLFLVDVPLELLKPWNLLV